MRRPMLGMAAVLGLCLIPATGAQAQVNTGVFADPFSFYYGYYLPHAAYVAAQPTPLDTINALTAARQVNATTDRSGLFDPISPFGEEDLDPLRPYSPRQARGGARAFNPNLHANIRGAGPAMFYNRTAQYYPQLRAGRGPNRNIAVLRNRGNIGMPSAPILNPGPR